MIGVLRVVWITSISDSTRDLHVAPRF